MVKTAYVYIWGKRIGAVAWDSESALAAFEYEPDFPLDEWPVAPLKMPRKGNIYLFPEHRNSETFRGLPGFLADSLPDRYGKELINIWLAQQGRPEHSLNPVELLCFIGKRGMGALEFEPVLHRKADSYELEFDTLVETTKKILSEKENVLIETSEEMRDIMFEILKLGTSAGGARPKAIIAYNEDTGQIRSGQAFSEEGYGHWLIKFDDVSDAQFGVSTGYGRVEMAYHKMAVDFGIEMMESRLIEESGRAHFMTRRFDRGASGEKLHVQTFCALQHYDYARITSYSYEQLFQTMRDLRLTYAEAEQMYRRMIFNVFARNCDDHTKNFSFRMSQEGQWQLAPAYDLCFAYRPDSHWVSQHLSINGKRKDFTREDLREIAQKNSIRLPDKVIDEGLELVAGWMKYASRYDVSRKKAEAIDGLLIKKI